MLLELIKSAALLLALSQLQSFNVRLWRGRPLVSQLAQGVLYGSICMAGMMMPINFAPGVIFDARSVVLSVAGLVGGPVVGSVAVLLAAGYRWYLGGAGAVVGVLVIVCSAGLGFGFRWLHLHKGLALGLRSLSIFGVLVQLVQIALFTQLPAEAAPSLLSVIALPMLLIFTPATVMLAWLEQDLQQRMAAEQEVQADLARFRGLLQDIPSVAVQGYTPDGTTTYWNTASERLYGYTAQEAIGRNLLDLVIPPDMREDVQSAMHIMFATGEPIPAGELSLIHKDGSDVPVFSSHALVRKSTDSAEMFCFDIDLADRKRAEAELRVAAIAFESQEGLFITGADRRIIRVNRMFTRITGYEAAEVIGQTGSMFSSGRHDAQFFADMDRALSHEGKWEGEIWNRRKNGDVFPQWLRVAVVADEKGRITNYVQTFVDITQRKAAEDQIQRLAFFDPLTSLPNRRMLINRLQHALMAAVRKTNSGAVLFIDLDHFKNLNDTLGHDVGDILLQQVAKRLLGCVREVDTVARLGGDEFVVMLEALDGDPEAAAAQATQVAEKILISLNKPYRLAGLDYHSSLSMGVAMFGGQYVSEDEVLKQADLAMYQAKNAGRNGMRFFDPQMQAAVTHRAALEADIRHGILLGQFLLYYQPQVDASGRTLGVEALLRWQHPVRGMVSPVEFIPVAEETGQIVALGSWVLETACAQLVEWARDPHAEHLTLSVNVSSRQFKQPDFSEHVLAMLDYTGANPQRLKLELTESLLADNLQDVVQKMHALRARGVGFSLDDFGTGYSSLSYLKQLPLDQLKIDQSFVRDVLADSNDAAIAKTIVALGQSLGLAVIAEGVETQEQRNFLLESGCSNYQGYLFSKPLPVAALEQYLRTASSVPAHIVGVE